MRQLLFVGALAGLATTAQAQAWETSAHLTGGGSNFRGTGTLRQAGFAVPRPAGSSSFTDYSPYGTRPGFAFGAALQQQHVSRGGLLLGLQAGYERLRSRIDLVALGAPLSSYRVRVQGRTHLTNNFLTVHPFVGQRFGRGQQLQLDLTAGADLGLLLCSREQGRATDEQGQEYTFDQELTQPILDVRARLGLATSYRRAGLSLSYSHGLSNYRRNQPDDVNKASAQLWRLGLSYRLR